MVVRAAEGAAGDGPANGRDPASGHALETFADIACGRGELAVWLVARGLARRAVCGDRRPAAAQAARRLADEAGVSGALEVRLGDGLAVLAPGEAEVVAIAGLGGETIAEIVEDGWQVAETARAIVLQPVRRAAYLRAWAARAGALWLAEDLVAEGGRFYPALALRLPGGPRPEGRRGGPEGEGAEVGTAEEEEALRSFAERGGWPSDLPRRLLWTVGPLLFCERHPLLPAFLAREAEEARALAQALERARGTAARRKAEAAASAARSFARLAALAGCAQGFARSGTNGGGGG